MMGCRPRSFHSGQADPSQAGVNHSLRWPEFCSAVDSDRILWNASRVQKEIQHLINEQGYKASGLSAYAEAYLAMTHERDVARCASQGPMVPRSALSRKLNDALADLMTKGLVESQRACLRQIQGQSGSVPSIGSQMCEISQKALSEKWSTLELSMASTAVYLTSLMGIALSALPHVDSLWVDTPYAKLEERVRAMNEFRETYDAFNLFLSDNLHTVANVLLREKRIDCGLFVTAARAAQITRAPALLFKEVRDKTFDLGLQLSRTWPRGLHPLTAGEPSWNVNRVFTAFVREPDALVKLREHGSSAISVLKNPLLKVFKGQDAATYVTFEGLTCSVKPQP